MAVFKCKMCGGALELSGNETVVTCDYCDSVQTVSKKNDDVIANLFNRANNLRIKGEFDKAAEVYERIINEDNTDAEAYWGLVLCKYGIEYVEDPKTFKRIPTCHRTQYESILTDVDYKAAISNADSVSQGVYKTQAEEIANLQKDILAIVKNEKPFDVFICYKETDENGRRTVDSALANDIYYQLTQEGLKVFYAAITLEDKLGVEYEPYIFAALNSAKVMLVVGTKPEYFEAVWVKNEWSRYLKIMKTDRSKILIPCYRDMDAYDLPDEFSHLQAQDMSKIGFVNDVVRGIRKIITPDAPKAEKETVIVNQSATGNAGALIKRAFMALEDGDFVRADDFCEQVLNIDAENAEAYLGKLMAEQKVRIRSNLANCGLPFDSSSNYQKAVRFGNEALVSELKGYIKHINERNENNRLKGIYNKALSAMSSSTIEDDFKQAAGIFKSISGYKDSDKLAEDCLAKAEEKRIEAERNRLEDIYNQALSAMSSSRTEDKFKQTAYIFKSISGYKDSDKLAEDCLAKAEEKRIEAERNREIAKKKVKKIIPIIVAAFAVLIGVVILAVNVIIPASRYNSALKLAEKGDYVSAAIAYGKSGGYKDAKEKSFELWGEIAVRETVAAGWGHTVGLKSDGT
ncbi:MAG: toll/interleukin-1 receptor domain-containing protein, partial [Acutalibacteraceae bacterium]|nr:toll/interleukin-1 receptor domain-containing protein [Acutalibacteraceae bacterium]